MQAVLTKCDLWEYTNGSNVQPTLKADNSNAAAVSEWVKNDQKAKSEIILSISPTELRQVKNCVTSREMWCRLDQIYQSKGPARKATLLKNLILCKMDDAGDIHEHLNAFFTSVDKLAEMEINVNPDLLAILMLYSLPSTFDNFRCAIESRDDLPEPEALRIKIIEECNARRNNLNGKSSGAMIANKGGPRDYRENIPITELTVKGMEKRTLSYVVSSVIVLGIVQQIVQVKRSTIAKSLQKTCA